MNFVPNGMTKNYKSRSRSPNSVPRSDSNSAFDKKNDILEENHLANDFGALHMFKNKKNLVVEPKTQKNNFENEFLVEEEVSLHQEDYTLGMEQNERIAPQMLDS